jgi:hypothetical protein
MEVSFPNESRSYDATRCAVRFWGYAHTIEASFFVSEEALKQLAPNMRFDEASFLRTFDANRALICAAAAKVFQRGRKGSYNIATTDF